MERTGGGRTCRMLRGSTGVPAAWHLGPAGHQAGRAGQREGGSLAPNCHGTSPRCDGASAAWSDLRARPTGRSGGRIGAGAAWNRIRPQKPTPPIDPQRPPMIQMPTPKHHPVVPQPAAAPGLRARQRRRAQHRRRRHRRSAGARRRAPRSGGGLQFRRAVRRHHRIGHDARAGAAHRHRVVVAGADPPAPLARLAAVAGAQAHRLRCRFLVARHAA